MIVRAPRITTRQRNALIKCFARDMISHSRPGKRIGQKISASEVAGVNRNTADLWYRYFREVIFTASRQAPRFFGEVEMDQKAFGGRGRKRMEAALKQFKKTLPYNEYQAKAKLIRAEHKTQVLGILQRGGAVYVHIIKKADKRTLEPIVRLVVEPGSTVFTDKWRGFIDLSLSKYTHRSVNHSIEYRAKDGTHINGIESFWAYAQGRLAKFNGIHTHVLALHLKECEFRYNNKDVAKALKVLMK